MSKSLNNFLTIEDCLKDYHPEVLRYIMLCSHYRSPVEYSDEAMRGAFFSLERLYSALSRNPWNYNVLLPEQFDKQIFTYQKSFNEAMADDLNTPVALSVLFDIVKEINRLMNLSLVLSQTTLGFMAEELVEAKLPDFRSQAASKLADMLKELGGILGLFKEEPNIFLADVRNKKINRPIDLPELSKNEIEALQQKRELARKNKDFTEADRIRDLLQKHGVALSGDKKIKE
jgi:cysteinyl-tRNA synthetase